MSTECSFGINVVHSFEFASRYSIVFKKVLPVEVKNVNFITEHIMRIKDSGQDDDKLHLWKFSNKSYTISETIKQYKLYAVDI